MNRLYKLTTLMFLMLFSFSLQAQNADDYRAAANSGDAEAQLNLGVCYYYGDGVTQDYKQAVYWYTKAANQGLDLAQSCLGDCYYYGYGVTQDYKQAVYWYTKAANQGCDLAQNNLGACYYDGYGVTQDYKQAVYWYTKAANQGDAKAQSNLGDCYLQGKGVDEDDKQAFFWHSKAANQGDAWSQMRLGYFFYSGEGVNKDYGQARYWSDKALNNPKASELAKTIAEITIQLLDDDKGSTTNTTSSNGQASQNTSTSSKPTANTVATNLSKGEWRTSMRKVVDNVTEKYSYNDAYKGQKSNGKKEGMGVYWWTSGSYYFGEWSNGDMNGYGLRVCGEGRAISNCPDCVYFVGNWKDDKKSGKGTCYDEYGNLIYYGDFADDRPTGTYPTTESYSSYKFECINYESNNSVYIGETKDGKRHGYGVYIWNNWYGNAWYGHWENDKRSGNGIDLFYDGSIKYGRWDGDEYYSILSQATTSSADGNSWEVSGSSRSYTDIATPLTYIKNQIDDRGKCRLGAITEYGKGIVIHGNNGYAYTSIPNSLIEKIKEIGENKNRISSITLTNSGYYCIVYQRNAWYGVVPQKMSEKLHEFNNNQEEIRSVSISENGDFAIVTDKHYYASNDSDFNSMNKAHDKYGSIKNVCVTNKGICVVCQRGIYYYNIPSNLETKLKRLEYRPDHVTFTDSGTYLITTETQRYSYWM